MRVAEDHRHRLLTELRESIRRIERRPAGRGGVAPSGLADLDEALPGGGFPRGALSELCGGEASGKTAAALSLLASMGEEELFGWVDGRGELYPPAAAARGVDLRRLLIVRPSFDSAAARGGRYAQDSAAARGGRYAQDSAAARGGRYAQDSAAADGRHARDERRLQASLWAAEALLGSSAFAAVVVDVPLTRALRGWDAAARRLQAAAEKGGAVGLWLSSPQAAVRVPAALRLELWAEGGRVRARPIRQAGEHARERTLGLGAGQAERTLPLSLRRGNVA